MFFNLVLIFGLKDWMQVDIYGLEDLTSYIILHDGDGLCVCVCVLSLFGVFVQGVTPCELQITCC